MFTVTATAQCILILNVCLEQWRNYNFWPPGKHSLHSVITVLVHNSGSLWTPFTVLGPCPPTALPGLPMASYAAGLEWQTLRSPTVACEVA